MENNTKTIKRSYFYIILTASSLVVAIIFFMFGSLFGRLSTAIAPSGDYNLAKLKQIYEIMNSNWYFANEVETQGQPLADYFIDHALQGMLSNEVDPFSYYTPKQKMESNTCGIGIIMERYDGYALVNAVYPASSADNAHFAKGDMIIAVNDEDITTLRNVEIQERVKGKCGTDTPKITLKKANNTVEEHILKRTPFTAKSVLLEDKSDKYVYVKILEFSSIVDTLFSDILTNNQASNLIVDLRDNGGGDLRSSVNLASMLLDNGLTVTTLKNRENTAINVEKVNAKVNKYQFEKIYILINENSASASEMVTLALLENMRDKVVVVGSKSYGKGTAQSVYTFKDGSEFRYTYAKWFSPNDNNIHHVGIEPTVKKISTYTNELKDLNYDPFTIYKENDTNLAIISAKSLLNYFDYNVKVNAYFDETFKTALLDFQQKQGLSLTGELDIKTNNRLLTKVMDAKRSEMDLQLNYVLNDIS